MLQLGANVALARLLSPEDFGLVAMVSTVMGFLIAFREMGLSTATIQSQTLSHGQVSNLFWTNLAVGMVIAVGLVAGAPAIAWFFNEERLVAITISLSFLFLLNAITVQNIALLNREMRFLAISAIEVGSLFVGVAVAVVMAWQGWGYWSLVALQLVPCVVRIPATGWFSRWRPSRPSRGQGTLRLIGFGANLTVAGFLYSFARGLDSLLVARIYGTDAVGIYSRASALLMRPVEQLVQPAYSVMVPALSRLCDDAERYRRMFLQVFSVMALAGCIFTGLFLPLAKPVTLVILGDKWVAVAPIFAALSVAAIYFPLSAAASWLFTSQGRGREMLKCSALGSFLLVVSFVAGIPFGPFGIAVAYSVGGLFIQVPLSFFLAGRAGPVSARDLWHAFFRQAPAVLVIGGATFFLQAALTPTSPLQEVLMVGLCSLAVAGVFLLLYPPCRNTLRNIFVAAREAAGMAKGRS